MYSIHIHFTFYIYMEHIHYTYTLYIYIIQIHYTYTLYIIHHTLYIDIYIYMCWRIWMIAYKYSVYSFNVYIHAKLRNHIYIIPHGISTKEWDSPGCRKKLFVWLKQVVNPHGKPGFPIFCKGFLGQYFLERAFWGAIDKLLKFLQFAKTAVVRRPSFVSQMSQTTYNIDSTFQLIVQRGHSSGTPDYCTFMSVWKQSVWTSYGVIPLGIFFS